MIVNLFRHTQTISVFIILSLCILIWMGFSFEISETTDYTTNSLYNYLVNPILKSVFAERILVGLLVFWQCIIMNRIMVRQKILSINSFYPALFYFLLISISPEVIHLSPALLSIGFILLALKKILSSYLEKEAYSNVFDSAFLISLAALIHPPFLIFIPLVWIGMSIFSQVEWRHWILSIIAIACPWFITYTMATFFSIDQLNLSSFLDFLLEENQTIVLNWGDFISLSAFGLLSIVSIIELINSLRQKNIKARKSYVLILWILLLALAYSYLSKDNFHIKLLIYAVPLSAIISNYYYFHKKTGWLNFLTFSLILILTANHFLF